MKVKVGFGWLSFELEVSFDEFLKLIDWLRKIFPAVKLSVVTTKQSCYTCKHKGDQNYCDRQALHYGERTCTGYEDYE